MTECPWLLPATGSELRTWCAVWLRQILVVLLALQGSRQKKAGLEWLWRVSDALWCGGGLPLFEYFHLSFICLIYNKGGAHMVLLLQPCWGIQVSWSPPRAPQDTHSTLGAPAQDPSWASMPLGMGIRQHFLKLWVTVVHSLRASGVVTVRSRAVSVRHRCDCL